MTEFQACLFLSKTSVSLTVAFSKCQILVWTRALIRFMPHGHRTLTSNGISKGREEKLRKHSTNTSQNEMKIVFPHLQACTCPNDPAMTYQCRMRRQGKVRKQKWRRTRKQDGRYGKWMGKPMRQSQPVMCVLASHPCRHPQLGSTDPGGLGHMHEK